MNLFDKFARHFGSADNAVNYLNMMGCNVNKGRFTEWMTGKRLPRAETLNLILSTVTGGELDLNPVVITTQPPAQPHVLNKSVSVDTLRAALPHRRFSDNYFQQLRMVDKEVEQVIYGYDVWERFRDQCGGTFKAVDVLRNAGLNRRVTESWVLNRIDSGWYPDVLNYMDGVIRDGLPQAEPDATPRVMSQKDVVIRYGFDVWKRFETLCGNFNNALYTLRRNTTGYNITENWLHNHIGREWPSDVLDVMVTLTERYEGTGTLFNAMTTQATVTPEIREYVRPFAMMMNPQCDFNAFPDDVIMQFYTDMQRG